MVTLTTENIITFSAVIVAIISLISSFYFNKRTLAQSERNLEIQLTHKDRNDSLYELSNLIKEDLTYEPYRNGIKSFLSGFEGQFIPKDIRKSTLNGLHKLDDFFYNENPVKDPEPTKKQFGEYWKRLQEEEEERKRQLDPLSKFEEEFTEKLGSFKGEIRAKIKHRLAKPTKK